MGSAMFHECIHLQDILEAQIEIIERHIEKHKWFNLIADKDKAIADLIEKYGFVMREFYCARACEDRFKCELAQQFHPK
jgi:hypothetical protein